MNTSETKRYTLCLLGMTTEHATKAEVDAAIEANADSDMEGEYNWVRDNQTGDVFEVIL